MAIAFQIPRNERSFSSIPVAKVSELSAVLDGISALNAEERSFHFEWRLSDKGE